MKKIIIIAVTLVIISSSYFYINYQKIINERIKINSEKEIEIKRIHNIEYYKCKCSCGNICIVEKKNIVSNYTKSCGCLQLEKVKNNTYRRTHNKKIQDYTKLG